MHLFISVLTVLVVHSCRSLNVKCHIEFKLFGWTMLQVIYPLSLMDIWV